MARQVELPPKEGGIVMKVGTCWTLPLTVAGLCLPFLGNAYCFPSIVSLACVIVSSTFVQWTIVLPLLLFLRRYCSDCHYCSPVFGSTIVCTSISRASAGSLYPSFGFNINLLLLFSLKSDPSSPHPVSRPNKAYWSLVVCSNITGVCAPLPQGGPDPKLGRSSP
jgi:hypothetical protein